MGTKPMARRAPDENPRGGNSRYSCGSQIPIINVRDPKQKGQETL